jgi:amidase
MGLRPTLGRVPAFVSTAEEPSITSQLTHVQGPLARTIHDLRLGLVTMAARDVRDPWWTPAQVVPDVAIQPVRIAVFAKTEGVDIDPAISSAVRQAARWLETAGYPVEEAAPPCFEEAARLFFTLVRTEEKAGTSKAIETLGDEPLRRARASTMAYAAELDFEGYVKAFARRATMLREWMLFFERYPLLLMPVSWERPFPVDFDQQGDDAVRRMLTAHHSMLAVSTLGLPGLALPTGLADGVPVGVQLVAGRFQEELCLKAGEVIEAQQQLVTPIDPRD